jgi:hypothetical protein
MLVRKTPAPLGHARGKRHSSCSRSLQTEEWSVEPAASRPSRRYPRRADGSGSRAPPMPSRKVAQPGQERSDLVCVAGWRPFMESPSDTSPIIWSGGRHGNYLPPARPGRTPSSGFLDGLHGPTRIQGRNAPKNGDGGAGFPGFSGFSLEKSPTRGAQARQQRRITAQRGGARPPAGLWSRFPGWHLPDSEPVNRNDSPRGTDGQRNSPRTAVSGRRRSFDHGRSGGGRASSTVPVERLRPGRSRPLRGQSAG